MNLCFRTFSREKFTFASEEAQEVLPFEGVLTMPHFKSPYVGLFSLHGKLYPVMGPLPPKDHNPSSYDEKAWLVLFKEYAQVAYGLPTVQADAEVLKFPEPFKQTITQASSF